MNTFRNFFYRFCLLIVYSNEGLNVKLLYDPNEVFRNAEIEDDAPYVDIVCPAKTFSILSAV